jgi:outer membrane cobalamin receptor
VSPQSLFRAAVAAVLTAAGAPALAQQATDQEQAVRLSAVVVEAPHADRGGPGVSQTGANAYGLSAQDIANLPAGENTTITDVLAQMPGVAIDQNQQIHIRNTEGPQFQYQIDGVMVPLDINTNPPFISMFNTMFVSKVDLLDGILPSRYSYATGGVVDIQTKNGCDEPGGKLSLTAGQRDTVQPSAQYAGCDGALSYYMSGMYQHSNMAFSSATPGPNPIHNLTDQGQGFGYFAWKLDDRTKLSLLTSLAVSDNQLPNVPGLAPQFTLDGVPSYDSAQINSYLNFRDYLGIVTLSHTVSPDLRWQIAYAAHSIAQVYLPDNSGELIFQGVASTAVHNDLDNTLQGDLTYQLGRHTLSAGFYFGGYRVIADDNSLVFPVDANGNQTSSTPVNVATNTHALNFLSGVYVDDLWQISDSLRLNAGLRWDDLTGFTQTNQFDPTVNLTWQLSPATTLHGGVARYMQVPSFQGIAPDASTAFNNTSGSAGPPGISTPLEETDVEWDTGIVHHLTPHLSLSQDVFYEITHHYLDTGQFGVVPIFAPFNYDHGTIWGSETALNYKDAHLSAYGNLTVGRNLEQGVATGQFNFDPDELAYLASHHIVLDHQPLVSVSSGASYRWDRFAVNLDGIYSSGLRAGFADTQHLPMVLQFNAGGQVDFSLPWVGKVSDRLTVLNLLDRTNLIRPAQGIGIFQAAYEPRLTFYDTLTVPF